MPGHDHRNLRSRCRNHRSRSTEYAGGKYPHEFLKGWTGTLVVDAYAGYDATMSLERRLTANCLAHARRKFDELVKANASAVPVDNNHIENQMRPWALGRKNWLFMGSQLAGERAAVVMSLLQSAKLNGHDPYAYLKDVLTRLPTQLNSRIEELLPHQWQSVG